MLTHLLPTARARRAILRRLALLILGIWLAGCEQGPAPEGPRAGARPPAAAAPAYRFAVHPLHNPAKLVEAYQPLMEYLNLHVSGPGLVVEASRDYATFEEKLADRGPEFLLPNPWQTLVAQQRGYRVIAMAGDPGDFTGIFVVRRNGGIRRPADLKGKAVSYPSPTALAACIMPQYFLHTHGIDVNADIENRYVGSQESSIMNAYLGLTAAGATWRTPWRAFQREHPQEAAELELIWETEPLVNNSVMARDDLPAPLVEQVRSALIALDRTPEGQAILRGMEISRFLPANDGDYEVVRGYVERFERAVRPVVAR